MVKFFGINDWLYIVAPFAFKIVRLIGCFAILKGSLCNIYCGEPEEVRFIKLEMVRMPFERYNV